MLEKEEGVSRRFEEKPKTRIYRFFFFSFSLTCATVTTACLLAREVNAKFMGLEFMGDGFFLGVAGDFVRDKRILLRMRIFEWEFFH